MDPKEFLKNSQIHFRNSSSAIIKIGCELEFFLLTKNQNEVDQFVSDLVNSGLKAERERGATQIEIKTNFTDDLAALCEELELAKQTIKNLAKGKNLEATFASQPFENDCGSALQFNISLHDQSNKNLFSEKPEILQSAINSLLASTNQMMIFLAPKAEDYQRFDRELNHKLFKNGKFTAPVNLSFGADNRSCAIRIAKGESGKRLEYRIAAADANPRLCISALLLALSQKTDLEFTPTFGNAFDEKFTLKTFCKNLEEAQKNSVFPIEVRGGDSCERGATLVALAYPEGIKS